MISALHLVYRIPEKIKQSPWHLVLATMFLFSCVRVIMMGGIVCI